MNLPGLLRAPMPVWRPTAAHVRCSLIGVGAALIALLTRRPDVLVIGAPLAIISGWSVLTRPHGNPNVAIEVDDPAVREGEATTLRATISDAAGAEMAVLVMPRTPWIVSRPSNGVVTTIMRGNFVEMSLPVRATRWGHHQLPRTLVVAASPWAGFSWTDRTPPHPLTSLPLPSVFDASAPIRRQVGLVGPDRSARPGDGTEFAGIRAFQHGDRTRRINWPRSLRSGTLQVVSTWADQDMLVVLEVDATVDVGRSGGIDGSSSSLDGAVRAAGAIAAHHVQRGDRVTLRVYGSAAAHAVPPATGHAHLRRVLDELAAINRGSDPSGFRSRGRWLAPPDALVVIFSPLLTPGAFERAVALARRGIAVAVVDTLPDDVAAEADPVVALAWRIRVLERRGEISRAEELGVGIVRWRGPGSLDLFLRDVARRASAPRMAAR